MTEIKVAVVPARQTEMVGGKPKLEDFSKRAGEIGDALNGIAESLRDRLQALVQQDTGGWHLDQVTLAFSLQLQGTTGVIMATASATAGMQATMSWKRS